MEEALIAYLLADPELADVVGIRIDWLKRPQGNVTPALTLQVVGVSRDYEMAGREGLTMSRVQMDTWAASYAGMKQAARALVLALDGLDFAPFQGAFIQSEFEAIDVLETPNVEGSTDIYRTSIDVLVWHNGTL